MGGDEPVETLAEVTDGHRMSVRRAADRQIEIDHRVSRIVGRQQQREAGVRAPRDHRVRIAGLDHAQAAVHTWREGRRTMIARERIRVTGGIEDNAPRLADLSGRAGRWQQRLRS